MTISEPGQLQSRHFLVSSLSPECGFSGYLTVVDIVLFWGIRLKDEENLPRTQMLESKWLAKCMLSYISRHKDRVDALFDLLSIFTTRTRINFHFLKTFLAEKVAGTYSVQEQKKVQRMNSNI